MTAKPITILDVDYPSLAQAAREIGVSKTTLRVAIQKDRVEALVANKTQNLIGRRGASDTTRMIDEAQPGEWVIYYTGDLSFDCTLHRRAVEIRRSAWQAMTEGLVLLTRRRHPAITSNCFEYIAVKLRNPGGLRVSDGERDHARREGRVTI